MQEVLVAAFLTGAVGVLVLVWTNSAREAHAEIWTVEDCVTEKWQQWEELRNAMPTVEQESSFREECWKALGAETSAG